MRQRQITDLVFSDSWISTVLLLQILSGPFDYEKSFNGAESQAVLITLEKKRSGKGYIDTLAEIQNKASTIAMLHRERNGIPTAYGKVIQFYQSYSRQN